MNGRSAPPAWAAGSRVQQALTRGEGPTEIWAAARPDVEVGLAVVAVLCGRWMLAEAAAVLAELAPVDAGCRAAVVVLRQQLRAMQDEEVAVAEVAAALPILVGEARWEEALAACGMLATSARDLGELRRVRVLAVGVAEAAGASHTGACQLRLLAAAELAAGEAVRCLAHLEHALRRLDGVPLLGARFERARCFELAGEAHAAAGDAVAADAAYGQAIAAYTHPDFARGYGARVAAKRAALAGSGETP